MQWWQLGFLIGAAYAIYRIFGPRVSDDNGLVQTPAVQAGATQGSAGDDSVTAPANVSLSPDQIAGTANPTPNLGYNFSMFGNNTFSPPGNSTSPTFLATSSEADAALSPVVAIYLANLGDTGYMQ